MKKSNDERGMRKKKSTVSAFIIALYVPAYQREFKLSTGDVMSPQRLEAVAGWRPAP
jgi:hypothetical protein